MRHPETALITGASSGIGFAFARVLARAGHDLVLVSRRESRLKECKDELERDFGVRVGFIVADLSTPDAAEKIYNELERRGTQVHILINNAGVGVFGDFLESDWEREEKVLSVNAITSTHLAKLLARKMVERKTGKILNVVSTAGLRPGPLMAVYSASKAYLLSFSQALASELRGKGVTVTALCPGPTNTGFRKAMEIDGSIPREHTHSPTAEEVAEYGCRSMMKGVTVAIHGRKNRVMDHFLRCLPRSLATRLVHIARERRRNLRSVTPR